MLFVFIMSAIKLLTLYYQCVQNPAVPSSLKEIMSKLASKTRFNPEICFKPTEISQLRYPLVI